MFIPRQARFYVDFTLRASRVHGLQPEVLGLQVEAGGVYRSLRFMLIFRARGWVYSPRCGVYRLSRRGLQVIAFYVVFSGTGQGLQPEVRVYSPRCGVYRSRQRGLQVIAFISIFEHRAWFTARGAGLQPEVRGLQIEAVGFTGRPLLYRTGFEHGARFTARGAGLQPRGAGLQVAGGGVYRSLLLCRFSSTGQGLQPVGAGLQVEERRGSYPVKLAFM